MWVALLTAVAGAIGILLGGGVRAWEQARARRVEATGLLSALAAEVEAITRLVRHRQYAESIQAIEQSALQMIAAGQGDQAAPFMTMSLKQNYFAVFEASVSKLGLLHPYHADRIARFYTYAKALTENYEPGSPFQAGVSATDALNIVQNDYMLLNTMLILGDHIAMFRNAGIPEGVTDPFAVIMQPHGEREAQAVNQPPQIEVGAKPD